MEDSENNKLIVRNVHALLPCVSKQIAITNKLLAKIDNLEKWWEELELLWKEIFLQKLKTNLKDVTLETLRRVRNLRGLDCSDTGITSLEPISNLTNLKALYFGKTGITTLEPIRNLTNLEVLNCWYTGITTLEPLSNLTNLRKLYCGGTGIITLEPIKNLTNLEVIVCDKTEITTLEPLSNLTNLEVLFCGETGITTLEPLKNLRNLKELLCKNTKISDMEIEKFKSEHPDMKMYIPSIEDLITKEDMVITVSHQGYIKRNPLSAYISQRRGGKGLIGMETKEEDFVEQLFISSTLDYMLFFSNLGRLYWLRLYEIPDAGITAKGKALVNLLQLSEGERITTAQPIRDFKEGFLVMFTKNGLVKKTELNEYSNPREKGIIAITIEKEDELIAVKKTDGKSDLIMGTKDGLAIRFNEEDMRTMGRHSMGVIGIRLQTGDEVIFADVAEENTTLLTVTEKGIGKRTRIEDYPLQDRGGKGVISIKLIEKGGKVTGLLPLWDTDEDKEVFVITNSRKLIRVYANNIGIHERNSQGVRLMDLDPGDRVVSIGRVVEKEND